MRSSTGEYYVGLDHVRAFAAFLVFSWHFLHVNDGQLQPLPGTYDFFAFSIFAEGHTGVSLFMVLSGYLFAKITRKAPLNYRRFFRARAVRLLPLLIAVCLLVLTKEYVLHGSTATRDALWDIAKGIILPTLPNGGWSITVEFHFYLMFPILVLLERRRPFGALVFVALGFVVRMSSVYLWPDVSVQDLAYWTIFGRVDQFVIGILMAYYGQRIAGQHGIAGLALITVLALYAYFDRLGGFYGNDTYPEIWLWLLTVEGLCYAILISWYDRSFSMKNSGLSGIFAKVGAASYSIYLLHVFFVFRMARMIDEKVISLDNFYIAFAACLVCFVPVALLSWFSYRYFELYWMRFRKTYIRQDASAQVHT